MNRGRWYLVYSYQEYMLFGFRNRSDKEIPLKATTEEGAIAEAKGIWETKIPKARPHLGKKLTDVFAYECYQPSVIYKIPLRWKKKQRRWQEKQQ